jgi:hypothetical protein
MTMLATRNIRKKTRRRSGVTLTDNDVFEADTVSPHDRDALKLVAEKWGIQDRLPNLIRGAARSSDLYEVHRCVVRESIRAARSAKAAGNGASYRDYLKTARDARRRAGECHRFARECEERANALITAGSSSPADCSADQDAKAANPAPFLFSKAVVR